MAQQQKRGQSDTRGKQKRADCSPALQVTEYLRARWVALANPDRPLTTKMKDFVKYWAQGESILSASVRAGYTDGGTYAYRLAKTGDPEDLPRGKKPMRKLSG